MSRRLRRPGTAPITEDQVHAMVFRARAEVAQILSRVLDDETGLAQIYVMHGQQAPVGPDPTAADSGEGSQVHAVCDRIAMLETTLTGALKPDMPSGRPACSCRWPASSCSSSGQG